MIRLCLSAFVFLLLMLMIRSQAIASDTVIRHEYSDSAITWIEYDDQKLRLNTEEKPTLKIPQGVTTHVFVENPNPFLLLYSASDVQLVDMPDVAALKEFGETIATVVKSFRQVPIAPLCTIEYDGISITDAIENLLGAIDEFSLIECKIDATLENGPFPVRVGSDDLSRCRDGNDDGDTNFLVDPNIAEQLLESMEKLDAARAELIRGNQIDLTAQFNGTTNQVTLDWSKVTNPNFASSCTGSSSANINDLQKAWLAFWELRVDLERWQIIARTLEQFNRDAVKAQERIALRDTKAKHVGFESVWSKTLTANVDLKINSFWTALLSDRAKRVRAELIGAEATAVTASYPIALEPERSVHFAISPGLIYSFLDKPSFAAIDDGLGGFTIQESNDDSGELDGAVALNIYPDRFYKQDFKPFFQVGIVPGDDIGFLLGMGAKLGDGVTVAIGAAFQEVDELRGGQQVGDIIASEDALSVGDDYDAGIYINLSYDIGIF